MVSYKSTFKLTFTNVNYQAREHRIDLFFYPARIMRNFALNEGDKVSPDEILEMYSKEHEKNEGNSGDASQTLSRVSLGRIIQDLWGGSVRQTKRGKRGEKAQKYYLNMGKILRSSNTAGSDTIHNNFNTTVQDGNQDAVLTSLNELELPNNWLKVINSARSLSFVRAEKWTLNGQRMVTELNIAEEDSEFRINISSQGVVLNVMDTNLGSELTGLKVDERVQLLIEFLNNSETGLCCGFSLPVGQDSLALHTSHRIVEINCLDERDSRTSEKFVFSKGCKLISPPGHCCSSCTLLKKRETMKQSKISSTGNDIKAKCNDRWLSKEQLKERMSRLRKDLKNTTAREKILAQLLQMT